MSMHSEIFEQPDRLENLLASQAGLAEHIATEIKTHDIQYAFIAARGTSDNAARYANYLWGAHNSLPVALATPSLFSYYRQPPRLSNALVVGISQSGRSPDIVSVMHEGMRQGNLTVAITNDPDSPLAQESDLVFDIRAGEELAVAATKTYTAELMAIAMLSTALNGDSDLRDNLFLLPDWVRVSLELDEEIKQAAQRYCYMGDCAVVGRGFNYASAFEWALKLKELTYINAEPYSSADFLHGPVAMVDHGFPIFTILSKGKVYQSMLDLLDRLNSELSAELVVISNSDKALSLAQTPFRISAQIPEWLSPLVNIVPAQLFAYHLARIKGYDPESPRSINKITETL
jgi:glucosamine--fructose-6-phosphate aminotransferase (isomerizing)